MSARVQQFASRFEAINEELIATVADCTTEQWCQPCANEDRSVGVVAHHVASVNGAFAKLIEKLAAGETYSPTISMDAIHESNAQHARDYATISTEDTLDTLRANGAAILQQLRSINDAQLDRTAGTFGDHQLSVAQVVEMVVIGHTAEHLESIRATIGG